MEKKCISNNILETIRSVALFHFSDGQVYLFGSRAIGGENSDSDYDVLILTNRVLTAAEKMPLKTQIRKELLLKGIRSDIVIQNIDEAERNRKLPGHFIRRIFHQAILL